MKIAVLSGKGGTGKTTVAASLASLLPDADYIDCDVEEPNGFLFLSPDLSLHDSVTVPVPEVDPALCTMYGACVRACQFNALAAVGSRIMVFPDLCHHCGACLIACKPGAICEIDQVIGQIDRSADGHFRQGVLRTGQPVGLPIIDRLIREADPDHLSILDAPPGSSCPVVHVLRSADYALLVTEPTPFGLHDLKMIVSLVRDLSLPAGVVINKSNGTDLIIDSFCRQENLPVLARIPFSRDIAVRYSRGYLPIDPDSPWRPLFNGLAERIRKETDR